MAQRERWPALPIVQGDGESLQLSGTENCGEFQSVKIHVAETVIFKNESARSSDHVVHDGFSRQLLDAFHVEDETDELGPVRSGTGFPP